MPAKNDLNALKQNLGNFLQSDAFALAPLPCGASSRSYFKINFQDELYFPESQIVLMVVPPNELQTLEDYMNIDYYLRRCEIPTPRLYEINQTKGWIFLEYKDSPTLEEHLRKNPQQTEKLLMQIIQFLITIQKRCKPEKHCPAFQRRFDYQKYMYEFNFHVQEQLLNFYYQKEPEQDIFQSFAHQISSVLDVAVPIFVHRDFQSSNIFFDPSANDAQFSIIDFQDARHGTPIYDLVSLLWDSYIEIDEKLRDELLQQYFQELPGLAVGWDWDMFKQLTDYTVIQRKLHDAGAFAWHYGRFNDKKYLAYIDSAVETTLQILQNYNRFSQVTKMLERLRSA